MTNPNPDLPPIPYSGIKIPGYERKLQCPYYNYYLYSYFLQIRLITLNCAIVVVALQRVNYASKAGAYPCAGGHPYVGDYPYIGAYAEVL